MADKHSAADYEGILTWLGGFTNYERKSDYTSGPETLGLGRIGMLLELLGNPQGKFRSVHIAGTKGKGSTSHMTAALLGASGLKVGLYTSPHLVDLRERVMVNRKPVSREAFCQAFTQLRPAVEKLSHSREWTPPTYFEILTALAFLVFAEEHVDVAVLEVGLGGRFDATNIVKPDVCAITPISIDHTRQLGSTVDKIAFEKAGIIKPGVPVLSAVQAPLALEVIAARAKELKSKLLLHGRDGFSVEARDTASHEPDRPFEITLTTPQGRYPDVRLPLLGRHQPGNAALACALADQFLKISGRAALTVANVRRAFRLFKMPARQEIILREPWTMLDGAHNTASAWALSETIRERFAGRKLALVFGAAADKDVAGMLRILAPLAHTIIATESGHDRALSSAEIVELIPQSLPCRVEAIPDPLVALQKARKLVGPEGFVCVAGSLYLAGKIKESLEREKAPAA